MSYLNKINKATKELDYVIRTCGSLGVHGSSLNYVKDTLKGVQIEMNRAISGMTLAEAERDSLLMALAGTNEGRSLDITNPHDVIQQAVLVIRSMAVDIITMREAEEIPFGAVEQDHEKMELEKRIAELELHLELKVDELAKLKSESESFRRRYSRNGSFNGFVAVGIIHELKPSEP